MLVLNRSLLIAGSAMILATPALAGDVVVELVGLRSTEGRVGALLWTQPVGFPSDRERADAAANATPESSEVTLVFRDVAPGRYAISAIHDENDNGTLDRNFMGIPSEGATISNDGMSYFGPRDFEETVVEVPADGLRVRLEFRYW